MLSVKIPMEEAACSSSCRCRNGLGPEARGVLDHFYSTGSAIYSLTFAIKVNKSRFAATSTKLAAVVGKVGKRKSRGLIYLRSVTASTLMPVCESMTSAMIFHAPFLPQSHPVLR